MAGMSYVVTGPLATPYRADGSRVYLYQGAAVDADALREGEVERLVDLGLVGEAGASADNDAPKKAAASRSNK
jgi:hypothetical protein